MKKILFFTTVVFFLAFVTANAQFDDLLNHVKDKANEKIDKTIDTVTSGKKGDSNNNNGDTNVNNNADNSVNNNAKVNSNQSPSIQIYKNYDFVPGDKIIFESQLANEQIAEIPSQFDLSEGQIDVQTENGENVIHIPKGVMAVFSPKMTNTSYLPDQFTVEFDAKNERFGTAHLGIKFGKDEDVIKEIQLIDGGGLNWTSGDVENPEGLNTDVEHGMTWHHFAIAVNKNQGKVYIDQFRVANVNNIVGKAQSIIFVVNGYENSFIRNIHIAEGGINVYKKVTTDGKIITHGILFDVDKTIIKPQSMGTINQIYNLLQKDPLLKFEIDGHTDNTGDANHNMTLSQLRANAVKAELVSLGIDASRLSTNGFGDAKPIDTNDTPEGKANNRRVEFVKI